MLAIICALALLPPVSIPAQSGCSTGEIAATALEAPVLAAFDDRIAGYMRVHNDVEQSLSVSRWYFDDPYEMFAAVEALRSGIRAARPDAQPGTVFTSAVAAVIRQRVNTQLTACKQRVEDVLSFINEERMPGVRKPVINERFPWELGPAMWRSLLAVLPPLPAELQYRFADRDLVLIDTHASLVVDILLNALPAPGADYEAHHR